MGSLGQSGFREGGCGRGQGGLRVRSLLSALPECPLWSPAPEVLLTPAVESPSTLHYALLSWTTLGTENRDTAQDEAPGP